MYLKYGLLEIIAGEPSNFFSFLALMSNEFAQIKIVSFLNGPYFFTEILIQKQFYLI
jgi:hypothetical protein